MTDITTAYCVIRRRDGYVYSIETPDRDDFHTVAETAIRNGAIVLNYAVTPAAALRNISAALQPGPPPWIDSGRCPNCIHLRYEHDNDGCIQCGCKAGYLP